MTIMNFLNQPSPVFFWPGDSELSAMRSHANSLSSLYYNFLCEQAQILAANGESNDAVYILDLAISYSPERDQAKNIRAMIVRE